MSYASIIGRDSDSEDDLDNNIDYCEDDYLKEIQYLVEDIKKNPSCDILNYISIIEVINLVIEYMSNFQRELYPVIDEDLTEYDLSQYACLTRTIMDNPNYPITKNDLYYIRDNMTKLMKL